MKKNLLIFLSLSSTILSFGQYSNNVLKMTSDDSIEDVKFWDILRFEGVQYKNISFSGNELKNKSYHLKVKEFKDGEIVLDSTIVNSTKIPFKQLQTVNDTVLNIRIVSKLTNKNMLKMNFNFPRFSVPIEFKAIETEDVYSLRNLVEESKLDIQYDEEFYLLAYILPYDREDGIKSYCDIGISGKDVENWGKKFGIKHYLIFEMKFE